MPIILQNPILKINSKCPVNLNKSSVLLVTISNESSLLNSSNDETVFEYLIRRSFAEMNIIFDELIISKTINGKPFLKSPKIFFNKSHTANKTVVAINSNNEVGVDIENIRYKKNILKIANRFFHQDEIIELDKIKSKIELTKKFYSMWTIKEAIVKCLGLTMFGQMSKINTVNMQWKDDTAQPDIYVAQFFLLQEYIVTIASTNLIDKVIIVNF